MNTVSNDELTTEGPSLLYFSASWCGPCKAFKPTVEKFDTETDSVNIHFIDVEDNPELAQSYNVKSVPTVVAVDSKEGGRFTGVKSLTGLTEFVEAEFGVESDA